MAKSESWYDSQANAAKLITYAALLILLGSIGWAGYSAWVQHKIEATIDAAQAAGTLTAAQAAMQTPDYHAATTVALGGIATAAFLYGVAVIIDLLIVGCEALRTKR